jgi:hypothetical protein
MIATVTLKSIVLVLFGLSILWMVKVVVKREFETLTRVLVVMLLIGGAYLYLVHTKHPYISWSILKQDILPGKPHTYTYIKEEPRPGAARLVRYLFPAPGPEGSEPGPSPKLKVTLDPNGRNYHITDIKPVNAVLSDLGLPPVKAGARELSAISGRLTDVNYYRWDDYELGILTLERGLCNDKDSLERYHCIVSLTIQNRY